MLSLNKASRTNGKYWGALGFGFKSAGPPVHKVSSFICNRSSLAPPKIMAPKRPFPIGKASFQSFAGLLNQMFSSFFCCEKENVVNNKQVIKDVSLMFFLIILVYTSPPAPLHRWR